MKKQLILLLLTSLTVILAFAQSNTPPNNFTPGYSSHPLPPPYDGKIPPPLNLGAAYDKAVLKLGAATNQFHCVSATCLPRLGNMVTADDSTSFGWTFVFLDTNGAPRNVYVYFNKASTVLVEDPANAGK